MEKTLLVLGGGIAGIVTARELRRHLGPRHRIVVVDRKEHHEFPASYPWVMIGWRQPSVLRKPLSLLAGHAVEFLCGDIEEIDPAGSTVRVSGTPVPYDYLVIALGGTRTTCAPAWPVECHPITSAGGALTAAERLSRLSSGRAAVVCPDPGAIFPPLAVEAALLLESLLVRKGLPHAHVDILVPGKSFLHPTLVSAEPALRRLLGERRVSIVPGAVAESATLAAYDLCVGIPPLTAPDLFRRSGLAGESGWITVDPQELRTSHERVFAVGDASGITLDDGSPLPKLGSLASSQAEAVARIISAELLGKSAPKEFDGVGYCFVETGNGRAGYIFADFYATPSPQVTFHEPNVTYHWGKVVFEKYWMWRWL